jgi:hypothetical protein
MVPYVEILLPFRYYFDDDLNTTATLRGQRTFRHAKQVFILLAHRQGHVTQELPITVATSH